MPSGDVGVFITLAARASPNRMKDRSHHVSTITKAAARPAGGRSRTFGPLYLCHRRVPQGPVIQTIVLTPGWNLVSFNVDPRDPDVREVLAPIAGLYTEVSTLFGGKAIVFRPELPDSLNSLKVIDASRGYWIRMTAGANLTTAGTQMAPATPIRISEGWNLVSYLPPKPLPVSEALASIEGTFAEVRGFDVEGQSYLPYVPAELNTLTTLRPGYGYLIYAVDSGMLVYPDS